MHQYSSITRMNIFYNKLILNCLITGMFIPYGLPWYLLIENKSGKV
jgi:hypothetical protein